MSLTSIYRATVDIGSMISAGDAGYQGAQCVGEKIWHKPSDENSSHSNPYRTFLPFVTTSALLFGTNIPSYTKLEPPKNIPIVAAGLTYAFLKNGLEGDKVPLNKNREIADGAFAGSTAGAVQSALRSRKLPCCFPRTVAGAATGAIAGTGLVLLNQLSDKMTKK